MLFNSYEFLFLFLPIVLGAYYFAIRFQSPSFARGVLILSSCMFYAWWDYRYLPLLLGSILFNYLWAAVIIKQPEGKKGWWLGWGICINLGVLFYYKYLQFAISVLNQILDAQIENPHFVLPLGISFFTFTQIAFLIDAYKQRTAVTTPASYALFVTIFPHLIAGPILHHRDMMNQFHDKETFKWNLDSFSKGIFLFSIGLLKKIMIADHLAPSVETIFDHPSVHLTFFDAWYGALAYTLQLYFDFSGYSDMAIGLGMLFNMHLPMNFDSPYKSQSIIEFWRRWHITLSRFLRDYIYISLGGSHCSRRRQSFNLGMTMLIGGLWHGAGWTFIVWGALHGIFLVINHAWTKRGYRLTTWIAWPLTFFLIVIGWVIFRSSDLFKAGTILFTMMGGSGVSFPIQGFPWGLERSLSINFSPLLIKSKDFFLLLIFIFTALVLPNSLEWMQRFRPKARWGFAVGIGMAISILFFNRVSEFLYYQF